MSRFGELLRAANNRKLLTAIGFPAHLLLITTGHQAQCLVAARGEEGWEHPIRDWV